MSSKRQATVDRFLVQYYRWALDETRKELLADLPRVRRVKGGLAQKYVRFIGSLKPNAVFPAATALVRRYHKRALEVMGEKLNEEDQGWIDVFLKFEGIFTPTWNPAIVDQEWNALVDSLKGPRLDKRRLARELRSRLKPIFESDGEAFGPQVRRYTTNHSSLVLQTYIDWGGRLPLRYDHSVITWRGNVMHRIIQSASLLAWLGVCGTTSWDFLTNEEIIPAAELVAELCAHFNTAFLQFDLN